MMRLEREPGKREVRYCHLFSDTPYQNPAQTVDNNILYDKQNESLQIPEKPSTLSRIEQLESEVAALKIQVEQLTALLAL